MLHKTISMYFSNNSEYLIGYITSVAVQKQISLPLPVSNMDPRDLNQLKKTFPPRFIPLTSRLHESSPDKTPIFSYEPA